MAGNTKFMGFGIKGMVTLARWGGEAHVEVSSDSLEALRKACYDGLPKKPPVQVTIANTQVEYDDRQGRVEIRMLPERALELAEIIEEKDPNLASELRLAHQEHVEYLDTSKEPGVDERQH
jgi:hypothetical protein